MRNDPLKRQLLVLALAAAVLGPQVAMAQPACGPFPGCLYAPPTTYGIDLAYLKMASSGVTEIERR